MSTSLTHLSTALFSALDSIQTIIVLVAGIVLLLEYTGSKLEYIIRETNK